MTRYNGLDKLVESMSMASLPMEGRITLSDVGLREWYKCQAQAIGCTINQVPPGHMPLRADDQQIISAFASVAFIYDLPHCPRGGASTVRGNPPAKDSEPEEGKMTDDLFEDEDRSRM
ncbi:hypothetical protein BKA82DRAFT_25398 [Pisolithus tinctorius]|uniref:Uncharacterized protein n=1 Tax=Pisolithus tinctorius Marx 270 TaxID=870435 RepID=A0A0C3NWK3_PISTI|nr:hypothetical protein BKA82DRAFT_25398 [Pisolithus tinctorius]KIO05225.1 hypothetical protein M404DRAFT_25398 [Pisolithus tinctorius Marx 270]